MEQVSKFRCYGSGGKVWYSGWTHGQRKEVTCPICNRTFKVKFSAKTDEGYMPRHNRKEVKQ